MIVLNVIKSFCLQVNLILTTSVLEKGSVDDFYTVANFMNQKLKTLNLLQLFLRKNRKFGPSLVTRAWTGQTEKQPSIFREIQS